MGCASQNGEPTTQQKLQSGYSALEQQQYDQAIVASDQILGTDATGPGAAEALYLRGRGYEDRPKVDAAAEAGDLQAARSAYLQGLQLQPGTQLEGRLRAGIALVAFCPDDYNTALAQWAAAYDMLDKPADKALTLYRMAQTEQRLGRWSQADQTLGTVQEQAAGSPLAAAAHALEGSRGFYVQVAKTANAHDAQSVITDLRQHGLTAQAVRDPNGASFDYVRVGPLTEYAQAQNLKARLASLYPQALIVP